MLWIAIEDTDTHEVSDFEPATENDVVYLMEGYRVDVTFPAKFRVKDTENGRHIVYSGAICKGGYGYSLWVASKYAEM